MSDYFLARAVHVVAVVFWIGGVAFVATILLPAVRRLRTLDEQLAFFEEIESGFARQARWTTLLAGASGLWLAHRLDAWHRFTEPGYWWMHAMLLLWIVFTLILFVLEPLWLHRWFRARAARDAAGTLALVATLHFVLLAISVLTLLGAAAGSHGWVF